VGGGSVPSTVLKLVPFLPLDCTYIHAVAKLYFPDEISAEEVQIDDAEKSVVCKSKETLQVATILRGLHREVLS
jgi:hypothetical protein